MIMKRLVDAKAKAAGKTPDDYVQGEIMARVGPISDAEVQQVYDAAKAQGRELPPFDQVKETSSASSSSRRGRRRPRPTTRSSRPRPRSRSCCRPTCAPKVEVEAKGPSRGPANAPVTIVEFSDFQCPYCSRAEETVSEVLRVYGDKIRLVFRDYPLPIHQHAPKAAEAAHCAGDQGKYWEMHDKLFANQRALEVPELKGYAQDLELDGPSSTSASTRARRPRLVEASKKAGDEAGVSGTPAFFVNGGLISGAQPFEAFKAVIDAELAAEVAPARPGWRARRGRR